MHALTAARSRTFLLSPTRASVLAVLSGVVFLTLMSQVLIPLPFTPVPLSLGTLGAMMIGVFLPPRGAIAATSLYAAVGAFGAPILAGFASGVKIASFGYVIGYILAAGLVSWGIRRTAITSRYGRTLLLAAVTSALIYVPGVAWMVVAFSMSPATAFSLGVTPFLLGDFLKTLVVAGIVYAVRPPAKSC